MARQQKPTSDHVTEAVMQLREWLMRYFKGDCVQAVVSTSNVVDIPHHSGRLTYGYQRRDAELDRGRLVHYESQPVFYVGLEPARLTFVQPRSDLLKQVGDQLTTFMATYLSGVPVTEAPEPEEDPHWARLRVMMDEYQQSANVRPMQVEWGDVQTNSFYIDEQMPF